MVVTAVPGASAATMRLTVPFFAVDGRAMIALPSRLRAAPRTKSTWPPMPVNCSGPIESATTCPIRSTWRAELMETTRSFWPMMYGSLVMSTGRMWTTGLSSTKSYRRRVPMRNVATILPGWKLLRALVMTPSW